MALREVLNVLLLSTHLPMPGEVAKKGTSVMGGPHVSTQTEEALQHVDAVIIGEGEFVWPQILLDLEKGELKSVYEGGTTNDLKELP